MTREGVIDLIRSIFRYPGGKSRKGIQNWILQHAPGDFQEYREPFIGGGGIFFAVEPSKRRWINDLDQHLIAVYQALQDNPDEFINKCRTIPGYDNDDDVERLKQVFNSIASNENEDPAFRFFFINRTVWLGRVIYEQRPYFAKPQGWNDNVFDRLEVASLFLTGTKVTCGDYEPLLTAPGDDVFIYCDSPYFKDWKGTQLYCHSFRVRDHERFAELVRQCKHKIAVSYEDDPDGYVRSLFDGLIMRETEWTYAGARLDRKRRGKELLILNYEPPRRSDLIEFM